MTRWAPAKTDTLEALAREILHNYARGRAIVAVDGVVGTTPFADDLAGALREIGHHVVRASIDDFRRPRGEAIADETPDPAGWYRNAYDYASFERMLVAPFRRRDGSGFATTTSDRDSSTSTAGVATSTPENAILLVDGAFLNRPELRGKWNYSIWLEVPTEADAGREAKPGVDVDADRAPTPEPDSSFNAARNSYSAEAEPRTAADAIIDNSDPEHPRRVFADSC